MSRAGDQARAVRRRSRRSWSRRPRQQEKKAAEVEARERAAADKKKAEEDAAAQKKAEAEKRQADKLAKERAAREAEVAKKNEVAKRQADQREKALIDAAARLKQAQAAYEEELQKAKGGAEPGGERQAAKSGASSRPGSNGVRGGQRHEESATRVRDEAGMSLVFVGMGMMAFLSASMLAIDVGMLMTARNQAQNSADAGALAGATALALDDYDDHSPTGPAVTSAITTGKANQVMGAVVSLNVSDVQFLNDPAGQPNRVKVTVYRRASRGNPISTLIARYFGMATADIGATATGEASPANAMTCVKPFTIPDRWIENQTPPWDPTDTFDLYDSSGNPLANPDVYIPATSATYSGYSAERDKGTEVLLKAGQRLEDRAELLLPLGDPGQLGRLGLPARHRRLQCADRPLRVRPDARAGQHGGTDRSGDGRPHCQGSRAPTGTPTNNKVVSTMNPSPRVVAIPLFDPAYYEDGKHSRPRRVAAGGELPRVLHRSDAGQPGQGHHHADRRPPHGRGLRNGSDWSIPQVHPIGSVRVSSRTVDGDGAADGFDHHARRGLQAPGRAAAAGVRSADRHPRGRGRARRRRRLTSASSTSAPTRRRGWRRSSGCARRSRRWRSSRLRPAPSPT